MQRQNDSFEELKTELLKRLEARGCTPITITGYRYQCNSIFVWLKENGYDSYSKEGGIAFLQNYYSKHGSSDYVIKWIKSLWFRPVLLFPCSFHFHKQIIADIISQIFQWFFDYIFCCDFYMRPQIRILPIVITD